MDRRQFIKYSGGGLAGLALGGSGLTTFSLALEDATKSSLPGDPTYSLTIDNTIARMIDDTEVPMWAFKDARTETVPASREHPSVPGPVLRATEHVTLTIGVTNKLTDVHAFSILGLLPKKIVDPMADPTVPAPIVDAQSEPMLRKILPGQTKIFEFEPDAAGTYLYTDPLNDGVNCVIGLHGPFIVLPMGMQGSGQLAASDLVTPYTTPTRQLQDLFNDLWQTDPAKRFGPHGLPWDAGNLTRERIWVFNQIDPEGIKYWLQGTLTPAEFKTNFRPRYFTLNGRSGIDCVHPAHHDNDHTHCGEVREDTVPKGNIGEPSLIRVVNAGFATHSPHIHGNHVFVLGQRDREGTLTVPDNVLERDTWTITPRSCIDVLLPFEVPPDIWPWPPRDPELFAQQLPLSYPMHCHTEMSQTAGGGAYPQGLIAHWEITGVYLNGQLVKAETVWPDPCHKVGLHPILAGTAIEGPHTFDTFGCTVFKKNPETPEKEMEKEVVAFGRQMFSNGELEMPGGAKVNMWGFDAVAPDVSAPLDQGCAGMEAMNHGVGGTVNRPWRPSPAIRVCEGQIVHSTLKASTNTHTIHHHAIEPTPFNDGVGHTSFEVSGSYTYQFRAGHDRGDEPNKQWIGAGTYFYHCHKNTPLHVEMGMYGALIVDPHGGREVPVIQPDGTTIIRGLAYGEPYPRELPAGPLYDVELVLVADEVDPNWHRLNHDAGLCGWEDVGMNVFVPKYFLLYSGLMRVPQGDGSHNMEVMSRFDAAGHGLHTRFGPSGDPVKTTDTLNKDVSLKIPAGKTVLIRYITAGYTLQHVMLCDSAGNVPKFTLIAEDARPLRGPYSQPIPMGGKAGCQAEMVMSSAQRFDLLWTPESAGCYEIKIEYHDWITDELWGVAKAVVDVDSCLSV